MSKLTLKETINLYCMQTTAKRINKYIRDSLEDLHSSNAVMDDETMPQINRAIREGILHYLISDVIDRQNNNNIRSSSILDDFFRAKVLFKYPPDYFEDVYIDLEYYSMVWDEVNNLN
jgi:hypothetical protein